MSERTKIEQGKPKKLSYMEEEDGEEEDEEEEDDEDEDEEEEEEEDEASDARSRARSRPSLPHPVRERAERSDRAPPTSCTVTTVTTPATRKAAATPALTTLCCHRNSSWRPSWTCGGILKVYVRIECACLQQTSRQHVRLPS